MLSLDIETYSGTDLSRCGVYRYAEDPDYRLLLLGYSVDGGPVQVVDVEHGEPLPPEILQAILSDEVTKTAFNAAFERICLSAWLRRQQIPLNNEDYGGPEDHVSDYLKPASWQCTMARCAYLGLPMSLEAAGEVMRLDKQKLSEGKELVKFFCMPCGGRKTPMTEGGTEDGTEDGTKGADTQDTNSFLSWCEGARDRHLPDDDPEKWARFKAYNARDVEAEQEILRKAEAFAPLPEDFWDQYHLDQEINDRGFEIDLDLAEKASQLDGEVRLQLLEELKEMTGLENPASKVQMKTWLQRRCVPVKSLDKEAVRDLLRILPDEWRDMMLKWQQLSKSSGKKYQAMLDCVCRDGRARGCFRFYGANRTGRFAGRLIQLQNLPRIYLTDLDEVRKRVKAGETVTFGHDAPVTGPEAPREVVSQLIRTALVAPAGKRFYVADFSAIEARVLAWLAREEWRQEAFRNGEDIYCASASRMFGVPVEKNGENSELRQKGKIAELALGYGGSIGALNAMGAREMGLNEFEMDQLVRDWRHSNRNIAKLWRYVDDLSKFVVRNRTREAVSEVELIYDRGYLVIRLPSGRGLYYFDPRVQSTKKLRSSMMDDLEGVYGPDTRKGGQTEDDEEFVSDGDIYAGSIRKARTSTWYEELSYMGMEVGKWTRQRTYGAKLIENITQGIARDILCFAMENLRKEGYHICGHVHDEVIIEANPGRDIESICEIMSQTPPWAKGLLLKAEGFVSRYYRKG